MDNQSYSAAIISAIKSANEYVGKNEFEKINNLGNRIAQVSYILEIDDYAYIGLILKEISIDLSGIHINNDEYKKFPTTSRGDQSNKNNSKKELQYSSDETKRSRTDAKKLFSSILDLIDNDKVCPISVFDAYYNTQKEFRKRMIPESERNYYDFNNDISDEYTIKNLGILSKNLHLLNTKNTKNLAIIINELALNHNLYGGKYTLLAYLYLKAFHHLIIFKFNSNNTDINEDISEFENHLFKLISSIKTKNYDNIIDDTFCLINKYMMDYRKYYTISGDILFNQKTGEFVFHDEENLTEEFDKFVKKTMNTSLE